MSFAHLGSCPPLVLRFSSCNRRTEGMTMINGIRIVAGSPRPSGSPGQKISPAGTVDKRGKGAAAVARGDSANATIQSETSNKLSQRELNRILNVTAMGTLGVLAGASVIHAGGDVWTAYRDAVAANPIETKACISGVIYSLGDLVAQSYEGRDIAEWDRSRVIRSGICGLIAHGPLSHLYYLALDHAFAQQSFITVSWMIPFAKIAIDQTVWSLCWNSIYYTLLGILKFESPSVIVASVKNSWWDLLRAGWRLWPMVHVLTYGVIPVQHRLLFVDLVEILWVSLLSIYAQKQRSDRTWTACPLPGADGEGGDPAEEILRGIDLQTEAILENVLGEKTVLVARDEISQVASKNDVAE